jgi:hypothetical protein
MFNSIVLLYWLSSSVTMSMGSNRFKHLAGQEEEMQKKLKWEPSPDGWMKFNAPGEFCSMQRRRRRWRAERLEMSRWST